MRRLLKNIAQGIDTLIDRIGSTVSWLTVILMLLICADVMMRYLFNNTKTWIIELEWHLFAVLFLIGSSYALLHDKHVRVDLFYERYSSAQRKWVNVLGIMLFLLPWCAVVIHYGLDYAANSFSFREASSQPGGLPARYVIKSFIVIGFILLALSGISLLIKSLINRK